jgi:predicted aspartyl protease
VFELIGSLDDRRRPVLRVPISGKDDILAIVDTASTGELLLDEEIAQSWGVLVLDVGAEIELGDGSRKFVKQGLLTVTWFGRERDATVQIVDRDPGVSGRRAPRDAEPFALVGTELLAPDVLNVNFTTGVVSIKRAE